MKRTYLIAAALLMGVSLLAVPAHSQSYNYVGSWEVDDGPSWGSAPPAYTGQQTAALLFGGTPSEYEISTNGSSPATINFEDWVSTWGGACDYNFPCGTLSAQNFVVTENGYYQIPGDTSSYVTDWAIGSQYTNYAFRVSAPEGGTSFLYLLLAVAACGAGVFFSSRNRSANLRVG
jgi:hypothetical protein